MSKKCLMGSEAQRETTLSNPLMSMPYRYEVKHLKGPFRLDYPTTCDDKRLRAMEDEAHEEKKIDDRIENELWRSTVDERRSGVRLARLRADVKEEVRVERKLNIMVRREALRQLFEKETDSFNKELNDIGLSLDRQLFA